MTKNHHGTVNMIGAPTVILYEKHMLKTEVV